MNIINLTTVNIIEFLWLVHTCDWSCDTPRVHILLICCLENVVAILYFYVAFDKDAQYTAYSVCMKVAVYTMIKFCAVITIIMCNSAWENACTIYFFTSLVNAQTRCKSYTQSCGLVRLLLSNETTQQQILLLCSVTTLLSV